MKRIAFFLSLSLLFLSRSIPALALGTRTVYAQDAEKSVISLKIYPGFGLNINFIPTGEVVKKAWLDDPSRIVLSFDGCLSEHHGQSCSNGGEGATVVHLRHIKPIQFEHLPRSPSGGTLLTLITEGAGGRKLYQFKVIPAFGTPEYSTLTLKPDSDRPTPPVLTVRTNFPLPVLSRRTTPTPVTPIPETPEETIPLTIPPSRETAHLLAIRYANDLAYGLVVAGQKGQIKYGTRAYRKVQSAIRWLRRGKSLEEAAKRSSVPVATLEQLIEWGQNRP